mgnify:FL=1
MGDQKPKNPLDAFWADLGDKEKLNVRSYGSRNGDHKNKKGNIITDGGPSTNSRKRRG